MPRGSTISIDRVYPRVYGGTSGILSRWFPCSGLSPRVWGNRFVGCSAPGVHGSIPACTGEPSPHCSVCPLLTVYPRVYGGTNGGNLRDGINEGLSPRVRGNLPRFLFEFINKRSIPACTGEPAVGDDDLSHGDKLRSIPACTGEPFGSLISAAAVLSMGLSPRVRGNLREDTASLGIVVHQVYPRVYGGNLIWPNALNNGRRVYPRVYGGTHHSLPS